MFHVNGKTFVSAQDAIKFTCEQIDGLKVKTIIGFNGGTYLNAPGQFFVFTSFDAASEFLESKRKEGLLFTLGDSEITKWDILGAIWIPHTITVEGIKSAKPELFRTSFYETKEKEELGDDWDEDCYIYIGKTSITNIVSEQESATKRFVKSAFRQLEGAKFVTCVGLNCDSLPSNGVLPELGKMATGQSKDVKKVIAGFTKKMGCVYPREIAAFSESFGEAELVNWLTNKLWSRIGSAA